METLAPSTMTFVFRLRFRVWDASAFVVCPLLEKDVLGYRTLSISELAAAIEYSPNRRFQLRVGSVDEDLLYPLLLFLDEHQVALELIVDD